MSRAASFRSAAPSIAPHPPEREAFPSTHAKGNPDHAAAAPIGTSAIPPIAIDQIRVALLAGRRPIRGRQEKPMRPTLAAIAALSLLAIGTAPASAAPACRDAKGKFVKCPEAKTVPPTRCKDSKGKFAKCGTPGATPVAGK